MTLKIAMLSVLLIAPLARAQQTLASLRDRNRVLLIFAPDTLDRRFGQQMDLIDKHAADFQARDLVVIPIVPDSAIGSASHILRQFQVPLVHDDEKITFRHRFHLDPSGFAVILLGKDGSEKLRSSVPISAARLNKAIDAMPMRKEEMKKKP